MRLYLDEDIASHELIRALSKAGHDVLRPADVNLMGESDSLQMTQAVKDDRILLTKNHRDFRQLHNLISLCGGSHPGLFLLRSDNDRRRDMRPAQVVNAIENLMKIVSSVRNHVISLNEWR
jgi:predicted nuclease of predicted toxin-antitoxin system